MKALITSFLLLCSSFSFGQHTKTICNFFEEPSNTIQIDSNSNWTIGQPFKLFMNSSIQGNSSIVTNLDSNYSNNDTSSFYVYYNGIPNYLGLFFPLEIDFYHKFKTDSNDFGSIHMSLDNGEKWYNVLSTKYNSHWNEQANQHHYLSSGDTINDSISIRGNSDGWVHSYIVKDIHQIIYNDTAFDDVIILRFSFISDSTGTDEGWQIDSLCLSVDYFTSVEETEKYSLEIYPNPNNGSFSIKTQNPVYEKLTIQNIYGAVVHSQLITSQLTELHLNLKSGVYILYIDDGTSTLTEKIVIK